MSNKKTLQIGLAGIGFMGVTHFNAYLSIPGVRVAAIAEMDPVKRSGDWSSVKGNFGSGGGKVDLSQIRTYPTYKEMAADPDLDLIDLCLPTPDHKKAAITCLSAGKHVLCEKPIALNLKDSEAMLLAAEKTGRHLFIGQVLRYFPEYRFVKQAVLKNTYGSLLAAHFRRIIAKPNWSAGSWLADPKKSGGASLDLHIHDVDFIRELLGSPRTVSSRGIASGKGGLDFITTQYDYGKKAPVVTSEGGWIAAAALPFEQSFELYFEKATLLYNSSNRPLQVLLANGKSLPARLSREDGFISELKAVVTPLCKGLCPTELLAQGAHESLKICLAEQNSALSGKSVTLR